MVVQSRDLHSDACCHQYCLKSRAVLALWVTSPAWMYFHWYFQACFFKPEGLSLGKDRTVFSVELVWWGGAMNPVLVIQHNVQNWVFAHLFP